MVGPQFNDLHKFFEAQDEELDGFVDEITSDFLTGLMEKQEKMAWMLRAFVEA